MSRRRETPRPDADASGEREEEEYPLVRVQPQASTEHSWPIPVGDGTTNVPARAARAWASRRRFSRTDRPYETSVWRGNTPALSLSRSSRCVLERAVADALHTVHLGDRGPVVLLFPQMVAGTLLGRAANPGHPGQGSHGRRLQGLCGLALLQLVSHVLEARLVAHAPAEVDATWIDIRDTVRSWLRTARDEKDIPAVVRGFAERMATGTIRDEELADALGRALAEPPPRPTRPSPSPPEKAPPPSPPKRPGRRPPSDAELLAMVDATPGDVDRPDVLFLYELDQADGARDGPGIIAARHRGKVSATRTSRAVTAFFRYLSDAKRRAITDDEIQTTTGWASVGKLVGEARRVLGLVRFPDAHLALDRDRVKGTYDARGLWPIHLARQAEPAPSRARRDLASRRASDRRTT